MEIKYPEGLLAWGGHREGGVSKLFSAESGKPTGELIKTRLVRKLESWTHDLLAGKKVPRTILLVGGPGNGKTEVLEHVIRSIDAALEIDGDLVREVQRLLPLPTGFSARKVTVSASSLPLGKLPPPFEYFDIVQDATSSAQPEGHLVPPEELFIEELAGLAGPSSSRVYIACVNRGILAHALSKSYANLPGSEQVIPLLEKITSAVTMSPRQPSCWPLEGYPDVGVWPMDVESLLEPTLDEDSHSPAHAIFMSALAAEKWADHSNCPAAKYCPFKANQESLREEKPLDHLLGILRCYELGSGKRWAFRDLFSLVANIVVGHESDFAVNGEYAGPCEWVRALARDLEDDSKRLRAALELTSRLYQHSLFPAWPRSKDLFKGKHVGQVLKDTANVAHPPKSFFSIFNDPTFAAPTDIRRRILGDMIELLDPAKASGKQEVAMGGLTLASLEEIFSFSVEMGLNRVNSLLSPQENLLLEWLARSEKCLDEECVKKTLINEAAVIKGTMRGFACRLAKRSLGVKAGACERSEMFKEYIDAIHDRVKLGKVRDVFNKLLNPSGFKVSLKVTYGQPVPPPAKDISLETDNINVKVVPAVQDASKPRTFIPYLSLDGGNYSIPITFGIFEALYSVKNCLHEGCLPSEVLALLEGARAKLAGLLVNQELDSARLVIGNTGVVLNVSYGLLEKL
ncbi:zeta toxin family protein [Geomonas agri]|uniref:zeta toxin family protein n=1 Tax=Geomonas agri TaxID=2873702 RepID=UPI001CD6D173|nr:zeta toxin family protein [Geomonas agri]